MRWAKVAFIEQLAAARQRVNVVQRPCAGIIVVQRKVYVFEAYPARGR